MVRGGDTERGAPVGGVKALLETFGVLRHVALRAEEDVEVVQIVGEDHVEAQGAGVHQAA